MKAQYADAQFKLNGSPLFSCSKLPNSIREREAW